MDLLVPQALAGPGNRAAQLGDHGNRTGGIVRGLEGTLVDCTLMSIGALDQQDLRSFDIRVAGPSGLLVAKLHKLADRGAEPGLRRLEDKDALDVLRLLRSISTEALVAGLRILRDAIVTMTVFGPGGAIELADTLLSAAGFSSAAEVELPPELPEVKLPPKPQEES